VAERLIAVAIFIFLGVLALTLAMGMPIAFSLLVGGISLMAMQGIADPQVLAMTVINGNDSYALLAIPFFLLAGEVMNAGGLSRRIVDLAMHLVGHVHGGLGYVGIVVGVLLGALSGSAVADAAAMAAFLLPMMKKQDYDVGRSSGLVAVAGLFAPIIPPSIALVFFGIQSNTSVSRLFLAGVFPGLLMALTLALTWAWLMRKEARRRQPPAPVRAVLASLRQALWALGLPVIIIAGLKFGVVTATEAAVLAAVYATFVAVVVYRELRPSELPRLVLSAMMTSASVMLIVACAALAGWMITVSGVGRQLVEMVEPLIGSPRLLVGAICVVVLLLGTALEPAPILLMLTPLLIIGLVTPPVGSVLAVVASAGKLEYDVVSRGATPFIATQLLLLGLLVAFPQMVTVPAAWLARP
jgi:TRAP-type transport system large permease protein